MCEDGWAHRTGATCLFAVAAAHSPADPAADAGPPGGGRPGHRRHGRRRDLRARRGDGRDGRSGRSARLSPGLRRLAGDRPALCRAGLPVAAGRRRLRLRPGGARPRVGVPHGLGLLGGVRAAVRVRDPWVRRLPERGHRVAGPPGSGRPRHRLHRLEPSRGEGIRAGPDPRGPDRPGRTGRLRRLGAARARPDPVAALRPPTAPTGCWRPRCWRSCPLAASTWSPPPGRRYNAPRTISPGHPADPGRRARAVPDGHPGRRRHPAGRATRHQQRPVGRCRPRLWAARSAAA